MRKARRPRNIAVVVLATMPLASAACVELKGPAPDMQTSPIEGDAQGGVDAAIVDGSVLEDGGARVIHPNASVLASKRTRLAAMPKEWVTSDNYVYLVEDKLRRIRPSTRATVEYRFSLGTGSPRITANDAFVGVVTDAAGTWYDADRTDYSQSIVKGKLLSNIALGSGNFAFTLWESAKPTVYVYQPATLGDPILVSAIDTPAAVIVGTRDRYAFLHVAASTDLWVADTALRKVSRWVLPSSDLLAVDETPGTAFEVAAAFATPKGPVFKHLGAGGTTRDLSGEIAGLDPSFPAQWRQAIDGTFAQSGKWFIYAVADGIVAFDRSQARLAPCQLGQSEGVVLRSPRVVEGNMLVFELEGGDLGKEGPPGLYTVKLDDVLPP